MVLTHHLDICAENRKILTQLLRVPRLPILVFQAGDADIHTARAAGCDSGEADRRAGIARAIDEAVALAAGDYRWHGLCGMATLEISGRAAGPDTGRAGGATPQCAALPNGESQSRFRQKARIQWSCG